MHPLLDQLIAMRFVLEQLPSQSAFSTYYKFFHL